MRYWQQIHQPTFQILIQPLIQHHQGNYCKKVPLPALLPHTILQWDNHHFPKIINMNESELKFTFSHCGKSLDKLKYEIKILNYENQVDCILHNLIKNNIAHLDMTKNGKNLCITDDGILSLIDFDIARINNKYLSAKIEKRFKNYGNNYDDYITKFRQEILSILMKHKYIIT